MAFLHKRKGSSYWYVNYWDKTGHKVSETTGQTDKKKANIILVEVEAMLREEKAKTLTVAKTREITNRICQRATGESPQFHSIEDWMQESLTQDKNNLADTTYNRYKKVIEEFLKFIGDKKGLSVDSLMEKDVRQFRDKQFKEGVSPDSCNMLLKILSIPITKAYRQGLISLNPVAAIKPIDKKEKKKRRETFTLNQVKDILEAAKENNDWYGCVLFGFFTGARLSDITNLKWESINLEQKRISLTPQKTSRHGTEVDSPIHPQLLAWLEKQPRFSPSNFVFTSLAGRPTGGTKGISAEFVKIMVKAGIVRKTIRTGKGRGYDTYNLSFHCLRHTCTTLLKESGVHPEMVMELIGHTNLETNQKYTHYGLQAKAAAIGALPWV